MKFNINEILSERQMGMINSYKQMYNYDPSLSFFMSLGMMSHFARGSYYTHFVGTDHRPVQLYMWVLGASGSGKSHAFRQMEKAITKTEKMFPSTYLKPVMVSGALTEEDVSSVVSHTNHIGLRQHLSSNCKILLNDDADIIAENYGLYNATDGGKEHERNLILCGYDGFKKSFRTTGTTIIKIDDKRLTIFIATTGGKLMKNMKNWSNCAGFDGSHNRFIYMVMPKMIYSRPQNFRRNRYSENNPSFNHLCVIAHLFEKVRYVFEMSESERENIYGATFDQSLSVPDEQSQSQNDHSSMYTLCNLIIDLKESNDQKLDQQQQIKDFYGKAADTIPRIACLIQLYYNAMSILSEVYETVVYSEGDDEDSVINEKFIVNVQNIIRSKFYVYDVTYLPRKKNVDQTTMDPMIIVHKDAVLAAWKWYEHQLDVVTTLFTIDYNFSTKPVTKHSSTVSEQTRLKELIMLCEFNIFPLSTLTDKHPITGQTGILKNRPALGEQALKELINDGLLKFNYFLLDARNRKIKSYMKIPITKANDELQECVKNKLIKHGINVDEYYSVYRISSIPPNNKLSPLSLEIFKYSSCLVPYYKCYKNHLETVIQHHIQNGSVQEVEDGCFVTTNEDVFSCDYNDIENLLLCNRRKQSDNNCKAANPPKPTTSSPIQLEKTTESVVNVPCNTHEKDCEEQHQDLDVQLIYEQHVDVNNKTPELDSSQILKDLDNSSISICSNQIETEILNGSTDDAHSSTLANMSLEEYMKSFYPHQKENVFTNNNWTLSDECIKVFQSDTFYVEHVRWDIQRFRPTDVLKEIDSNNENELPLTQISHSLPCEKSVTDDIPHQLTQQLQIDATTEAETTSTLALTVRPKRKLRAVDDQENEVRTQPRRMKKKY
ncbi:hypothetical protein I4U23_011021 [Adineta vaga]|nr:hypothetical protein I4U23_011021 [Adineta vaga]